MGIAGNSSIGTVKRVSGYLLDARDSGAIPTEHAYDMATSYSSGSPWPMEEEIAALAARISTCDSTSLIRAFRIYFAA